MKQVILGFVGIFITIYTVLICLNIYSIQVHKNQLEHMVCRAVQNGLENYYHTGDSGAAREQIISEIVSGKNGKQIVVEILKMDLEKGILSVKATETLSLVTGGQKELVCIKSAIMEKKTVDYPHVTVTFLVDGIIYKQMQIQRGEVCPTPKTPFEVFQGWRDQTSGTTVLEIGRVWEDKLFIGIGS